MRNGVAPFNGALYSTVTTSLFTVYFRDETTSILWAFVAGGGFIRLSEITTAFLSNMHNTYLVLARVSVCRLKQHFPPDNFVDKMRLKKKQ